LLQRVDYRADSPLPGMSPHTCAEFVLTYSRSMRDLPAKTANRSTTTQIYEGTNQIQRMVMARQLLKGR
jgi:hypothetical protein